MKSKSKDRTGETYNRLTVLSQAENSEPTASHPNGRTMWNCKCSCEAEVAVQSASLLNGHTKSCGCLKKDLTTERLTTHGLSHTPEYGAWLNAKDRCLNPDNAAYKNYGGRGITMCSEWQDDFPAFLAHVGPKPSPELSIDRIDFDGNYEVGNLRWAKYQANNNRRCSPQYQDQGAK